MNGNFIFINYQQFKTIFYTMSDSKVFMFPENGYNNNGGLFGGNGWGGGILGFILGILLGNGGFFGNGMWGNNGLGYGLANQINNDNNTDLVMNAINGTDADVRQLATTLNADLGQVTAAIQTVQNAIQQVGAQNGLGFMQVTNAIQAGNSQISRQLCECCCENRLLTTQQGYEGRIQTIEHTNALNNTINGNGRSITDSIADLKTTMVSEFCNARERDMQAKIETQGDIITQLRNQISNDNQTIQFNNAFKALDDKIDAIAAKQPNTVPVTWPNLTAVNNTPYAGAMYGGFYGGGFGNNIIF